MAATELQRRWRLPALAALVALSGCKDLAPTYVGGDIGAAAFHGSQGGGTPSRIGGAHLGKVVIRCVD